MRFTIAYYLLLVYVSVLFRPAFPLVSDALSHFFSESVHLSTIHMVYGEQHLQKEMAAENAESKKSSSHSSEKSIELFAIHLLQSDVQFSFLKRISNYIFPLFLVNKLPLWCTLQNVPPPDFFG